MYLDKKIRMKNDYGIKKREICNEKN